MLESGHSIADYQIVTPLTENPLFETYQVTAANGDFGKLLLIAPEQLTEKKARQAFVEQSQLLLGQSFPGICSLSAADANDEYSYCFYPFPLGDSLAERLTEPFLVRRSLEIVKELSNHLSSAHAAGLWHGAVSPTTIYLDGDRVSLDQFALASLVRMDFHSGIDPCYSSPELVRGESLSSASDLYSLGIVLYRLLTGAVPFGGDDPFATAMLHVQEQSSPLPDSLSLLQPLIDGLLQVVASERWNAERLVAELDRYLQLPQIDSLELPLEEKLATAPELTPEETEPSKIEKVMDDSDMTSRIEQRLRERAEVLQETEDLTLDAKQANTARMSAIGQQSYRKTQDMNSNRQQQKSGTGRYFILIAVGIAVGIIIYLTIFGSQKTLQQDTSIMPAALVAGLESGSRQLEQGDVAAAEKTFSGLVDKFTLYPQPYNNLAAIYARQGDLERARNILERAMATDESYATIYRNLGTVYSEMARDSYGRALQLDKGQQAVTLQVFDGTQLLAVNSAVTGKTAAMDKDAAEEAEENADSGPATSTEQPSLAIVEKTPAVEDESVTEVVLAPEPESAEVFLNRWAAAWSAQDVVEYLSFYAAEFTPSAGVSREAWAKQREGRLTKPKSIEITLEDFAQIRQTEAGLQIEVTQGYKSDRYEDRTRKLFNLSKDKHSWQIVRERSLGRVR
ncbi:tetratricopeptide repeat protein [Deltaproteobacteria bacterium]|nr:tetratricopeptide repeat protein [Deltaproteobacteria bacterium]